MKVLKTYYVFNGGLVLGDYWGGGTGSYPATQFNLKFPTAVEVLNKAEEMLEDGSLDGGMGFQNLRGALILVKKVQRIEYRGNIYEHAVTTDYFIGELTLREANFLMESL